MRLIAPYEASNPSLVGLASLIFGMPLTLAVVTADIPRQRLAPAEQANVMRQLDALNDAGTWGQNIRMTYNFNTAFPYSLQALRS